MFNELNNNFTNNTNNTNNTNTEFSANSIPDSKTIHDHINNLINGKIGSLAKELAEETSKDLDIDLENQDINSVNDVFQKLFKNPGKLMNLVNNIGSKLDQKIKDGSIKESELLEEANSLMKNMGSMPGMGNFEDILKSMGKNVPKGGKFNNNAFQHMMDQNIKISKMKERMRKKAETNKTKTNESNYEKNYSENPNDLNSLNSNLESLMKQMNELQNNNNNSFIEDIIKKQQNKNNNQTNTQNPKKRNNKKKNKN